jgi:hypothetical protein
MRKKKKKARKKGRIPLEVLEERLKSLTAKVKSRGGYLPGDV